MKRLIALLLTMGLALGAICPASADEPYISVIARGEYDPYWQVLLKGCDDAARANGALLLYYGPAMETDVSGQVDALKREIAKSPDAIVLASLNTRAILPQLSACIEQEIPVIAFEAGVPDAPEGAIFATVSANEYGAGALAAQSLVNEYDFFSRLQNATPESPCVISVLSQDAKSPAAEERITGFIDTLNAPDMELGAVSVLGRLTQSGEASKAGIVVHVIYAASQEQDDLAKAIESAMNLDGLCAIYCADEPIANSLLSATNGGSDLAKNTRSGAVWTIGYGAGALQKNAVRMGWLMGAIAQDPYQMGYQAVNHAAQAARDESVEDLRVDAVWYDAGNIDTPQIALVAFD